MMLVHHTRNTIESEPVKHVFVHVEPEIREEEAHDLMVTIVEESTIPELVSSSRAFVEVAVVGAVKVVEAAKD